MHPIRDVPRVMPKCMLGLKRPAESDFGDRNTRREKLNSRARGIGQELPVLDTRTSDCFSAVAATGTLIRQRLQCHLELTLIRIARLYGPFNLFRYDLILSRRSIEEF
jgi:hypothetical protein